MFTEKELKVLNEFKDTLLDDALSRVLDIVIDDSKELDKFREEREEIKSNIKRISYDITFGMLAFLIALIVSALSYSILSIIIVVVAVMFIVDGLGVLGCLLQ